MFKQIFFLYAYIFYPLFLLLVSYKVYRFCINIFLQKVKSNSSVLIRLFLT